LAALLAIPAVVLTVEGPLGASPIDRHQLTVTVVGAINQCCTRGAKTPCGQSSTYTCHNTPIVCNSGSATDDACGSATCSNSKEGDNCSTVTIFNYAAQKCTADGGQTATGCPVGQARCTFTVANTTIIITACGTGSTLCGTQPSPACS